MESSSEPTISSFAKLAGVSVATVSRVTSRQTIVREATRRRVEEAIALCGYTPNETASSMSQLAISARKSRQVSS